MVNIQQILDKTEGFGVIYRLTSPSGKSYIGQSTDFCKRLGTYRTKKKKNVGPKLTNALNKYGLENFNVSILASFSLNLPEDQLKKQLNEWETFCIEYYDTLENGYNCTKGGEGNLGWVMPEDTKEKMIAAKKGVLLVERVECTCLYCGKVFYETPGKLKARLSLSKTKDLYCSRRCYSLHKPIKATKVEIECAYCGKKRVVPRHQYNSLMVDSTSKLMFCDSKCYKKYKKEKK